MNSSRSQRQRIAGRWFGAVLAVVAGLLFWAPFFSARFNQLSYELAFYFKPPVTPEEIVIVYLDEESREHFQQKPGAAWDRKLLAQLLRRLRADGSRTVLFDFVFDVPSADPADDLALAAALREHGRVVLSDRKLLPVFATNAAALGPEKVFADSDHVVRRLFSTHTYENGETVTAFTWRAAELEHAPVTRRRGGGWERWVNYYGPPDTMAHLRFRDALAGVPDGYFSNKVVLVGAPSEIGFADAGKDTFGNPTGRGGEFSGVEIHATIFANLLRGEWLRSSLPQQALLLVLFGAGFGGLLARFRPLGASVLAVVLALLVAAAGCASAWWLHFWFPWLTVVVVQIPIACGWAVLFQWVQSQLQNQFLEQSMSMYLSPKLVKKFARDKDRSLLQPGAQKQTLTFLFSDIAGFTSVSEGMDSDELALMMNEYFERAVGSCVHPTDGTVVKYIGDAIFAFWNAPEPQPDHARRACDAALRFRAMSNTEVRGKKLITRIGLHTGVANVGNFGSSTRVDYTAIGEDVNLAARMEGLNKYLGTTVLLTGAVRAAMGDDFVTRYLGRFQLKGFEQAAEVYELIGAADTAGATAFFNQFDHAVQVFQKGDFAAAGEIFHRVQDALPHDGPTKFYLKHLEEVRGHTLPPAWRGEVELKEK